jgi:FixJ family two-component response regulator
MPPLIYILDDDDAVRDSLSMLLESHGFNVRSYASVDTFARNYIPGSRACLILDHHLPGMTGLDYLALVAKAGADLPVILITGGADPVIRKRAGELSVVAFFEKPVNEVPLLAAIGDALSGGND